MNRLTRFGGPACLLLGLNATANGQAPPAATAQATTVSPEQRLLRALRANPVTAPYAFQVARRNGQLALSGRVASGGVHDAAIQTALALGLPVRDDLVIDTGIGVGPVNLFPPPTLLGPPPVVAFPPWFGALAGRAPVGASAILPPDVEVEANAPGGVELTLDVRGVAMLRGVVGSNEERLEYARKVAAVPGVRQVVNLLEVSEEVASIGEEPPPPPQPFVPRPPEPGPAADAPAPIDLTDPLARKITEAIGKRPALAGVPVSVAVRDGVATLTGRVPSAYEAMLAFRAAQQTPGVRDVEDRLSFDAPEEGRPSPLARKGRPEDLVPYLLFHARRHLGDLAHLDQITVRGDTLEATGTVAHADDVARAEATLRSIPLLRGFRIEPRFLVD